MFIFELIIFSSPSDSNKEKYEHNCYNDDDIYESKTDNTPPRKTMLCEDVD